MTKIKNTKKGMAKKTLSISLAVAMLATSNVPVWAAEFTDGTDAAFTSEAVVETPVEEVVADAPVVEEEVAPEAQVAADYTVDTNRELKDIDWATPLSFAKKTGVTEDAKFVIRDKNKVDVTETIEKVEVYYGDSLVRTADSVDNLGSETVGFENYKKGAKTVTIKVYVKGENEAVYTDTASVKAVDISSGWTVTWDSWKEVYNGQKLYPTGHVTKNGVEAKVVYDFVKDTEAKNVRPYSISEGYEFTIVGDEQFGFTGSISGDASGNRFKFYIEAAEASEKNLSVSVSGKATYNGTTKNKPTVTVTNKLTGEVLDSKLYDVTLSDKVAGTYTKDDVTVKLNSSYTKEDGTVVYNNFKNNSEDKIPAACISGTFEIEALDLSKLDEKYDISIADKKVDQDVTAADITFVDKTTKKVVPTENVLLLKGASTGLNADETVIKTSNNGSVGEGKVEIFAKDPKSDDVINVYAGKFNVVNDIVTKADVAFAKGTKVGSKPYIKVMPLEDKDTDTTNDAASDITAILGTTEKPVIEYTGSAIEPLKEAFSKNLVLLDSKTVEPQPLVLGTDYTLTYSENTTSTDVSKKTAKITFKFIGKYSGSFSYEFKIMKAKATVSAADFEYEPGTNTYKLNATVTVGKDKKAVPATEYTVTPVQRAFKRGDVGASVVVFNNPNYTGTAATIPTINKIDDLSKTNPVGVTADGRYCARVEAPLAERKLSNCTATIEGNYVYTGEPISPKLIVKDGDIVLKEGVDYEITSRVGTDAGKAYLVITGIGNYTGDLTVEYVIAKANLKDAVVKSSKEAGKEKNYDKSYTGFAQAPDIATVWIGKKQLFEYDPVSKTGDYVLTYDENAVEVGTYNFTLTTVPSSKNVEGTFTGTFKVVRNELTGTFVTKLGQKPAGTNALPVSVTGAYYTGKEITIDNFKTKYVIIDNKTNNVLTEGKEYRLVYKNNVDAGIATVEAWGIGNYTHVDENNVEAPIASMTFHIEPKAVITTDMVQKINNVEYAGGLPVEPEVVVIDEKGNRLVQGVDYTVTTDVTDIIKNGAGEYDYKAVYTASKVTIKGKGAYVTATKSGTNVTVDHSNTGLTGFTTNNTDLQWKVTKKDLKNTTVTVDKNDNVIVMNGTVVVPSTEYTVAFSDDGSKVTVTAKADSAHYTGSKEQDVDVAKVGKAMIKEVKVVGNKATVILSDKVENAEGYDFVIATEADYKNGRVDITKNQLKTSGDFTYVQKGVYYAYCHAWKRDENNQKVFGDWSNLFQFTVSATTPETPVITSVKRSGKNVTVTYKNAKNAEGYDVVLGSKRTKVNGELRPVEYGKLVQKNKTTTTVTFKNVPKGRYYVGMHAYNRSSVDNKKVFSRWANWSSSVTVK